MDCTPAAAGGDKEAAARRLLRQERAGLQDRKLDVVVRFNGSTDPWCLFLWQMLPLASFLAACSFIHCLIT